MPGWLVSFVVHTAGILLLGLWMLPSTSEPPAVTLSASLSYDDEAGELEDFVEIEELFPDTFEVDPGVLEPETLVDLHDIGQTDLLTEALPIVAADLVGTLPGWKEGATTAPPAAGGGMLAGRNPALRAQLVRREGGTPLTELAVARGLQWLARHQNYEGSWSLDAFPKACGGGRQSTARSDRLCTGRGEKSDTAGTALGLLPFLGAGHTHLEGEYSEEIRKGLRWLIENQEKDGDLRGPGGIGRMYAHGQAAIVLCEAYAITGDRWLRAPAQRALDFIVRAQHSEGGWRYSPGQRGDTSVVGWQLMALQSGRIHYLPVPEKTMVLAGRFLDQVGCDEIGGLYAYQPNGHATAVMTAEALLCRLYLGWPPDHPGVKAGVSYLMKHMPNKRSPDIYYWYYATQVMHHVGGSNWRRWNSKMRSVLVGSQQTRGHASGSWDPGGRFARSGGRIYMTSLAVCTLEVYYRHMPLHRKEAVPGYIGVAGR